MTEINIILNEGLVYLSENMNSIVWFQLIIVLSSIVMNLAFMYSAKQEFAYKRYDERRYYASKIRKNYLIQLFVCLLFIKYCKNQKYLHELDVVYVFFTILILIYYWKKIEIRISRLACIKYSAELNFKNETEQILGYEAKNKNELLCNRVLALTKRHIEHEHLKMDILKYLVSPAIITSFISFILNNEIKHSTLILILLLSLLTILWATYQNLNELQLEAFIYETTLYNIKNRIMYTKEEKEKLEKEQISRNFNRFSHLDFEDRMSSVYDRQSQDS